MKGLNTLEPQKEDTTLGNMKIIKRIRNKKKVFFDVGKFDKYCVYIGDDYGRREALKDGEYFKFFHNIKPIYGNKIFQDFQEIYEATTRKIDKDVRLLIDNITSTYNEEHQENVEKYLTIMYGGMVAELNKENTMLGKRIKMLGMYQVLKENIEPDVAANYSRNMHWGDLDKIMKERGI